MKDGFYRQTARVEEAHWWFLHRRRLVQALLESRAGLGGRRLRVLDIGCGSGGNVAWLAGLGHAAMGLDRSAVALDLCRARSGAAPFVQARAQDVARLFRPASFSLVTLLNVLYHEWIESDLDVLAAARRVLEPGGHLLLTEPAFGWLRRRHDATCFGARRYTLPGIERVVTQAGFELVRTSYFNAVGLAPAALVAALDRLRAARAHGDALEETREIAVPAPALNRLLLALCSLERIWIERVGRMPIGVGVLVLARNPSGRGGSVPASADQVGT